MPPKQNEMDEEIADLERMTRKPPSGGGGAIGLNDYFSVDGKEGAAVGVLFTPGKYALQVIDLEMKESKGGIDDRTQVAKEKIPYLEITFQVIAGDDMEFVGQQITDRLMARGKGVTRFKIFAKAIGLWDDEKDQFTGRPIDFMEAFVWATVKTEKSTYQGNERERSIIDFAGYEPISKYPMPDDSYFGQATGEDEPPAAPVAGMDEEEPEEVEGDLVDGDETDGDLEPLDDPEPVAEKPVARPRPRAAAAAGQPSRTAPWK